MSEQTTERERCETCRFMREGMCCRNPPVVVVEIWRDTEQSWARATWPEVDDDHWCGEWKARDA